MCRSWQWSSQLYVQASPILCEAIGEPWAHAPTGEWLRASPEVQKELLHLEVKTLTLSRAWLQHLWDSGASLPMDQHSAWPAQSRRRPWHLCAVWALHPRLWQVGQHSSSNRKPLIHSLSKIHRASTVSQALYSVLGLEQCRQMWILWCGPCPPGTYSSVRETEN